MENSEFEISEYNKKQPEKLCYKLTKWTFILYNLLLLVK